MAILRAATTLTGQHIDVKNNKSKGLFVHYNKIIQYSFQS